KKDRVLPLAPEAAELLESVPTEERSGLVFKLRSRADLDRPLLVDNVSPLVVEIGKKAGIRVSERKTASAHDLQRSFGLRWADRVKPHVLQQLMRHASSQTTLTFYVQSDAADMAELVWSAFEKGAKVGTKTVPNQKTTSDELSGSES
ncbi:MAG: tyrosine-type recombinase/integrase, partial [Planctomyces sp.]